MLFRVTASTLNLRSRPSTEAPIVERLPLGFVVTGYPLGSDAGGFRKVDAALRDGPVSGYAADAFLEQLAGPLAAQAIPRWLTFAMGEIGIREYAGPEDNPRILEYHAQTSLKASHDEVAWCSAFVNWAMEMAGVLGTNSAAARSWLSWGRETKPRLGAVCVLKRGSNPAQGHVAFLLEARETKVHLLGGNQGNQVKVSTYPMDAVLGFRWPREGA